MAAIMMCGHPPKSHSDPPYCDCKHPLAYMISAEIRKGTKRVPEDAIYHMYTRADIQRLYGTTTIAEGETFTVQVEGGTLGGA